MNASNHKITLLFGKKLENVGEKATSIPHFSGSGSSEITMFEVMWNSKNHNPPSNVTGRNGHVNYYISKGNFSSSPKLKLTEAVYFRAPLETPSLVVFFNENLSYQNLKSYLFLIVFIIIQPWLHECCLEF